MMGMRRTVSVIAAALAVGTASMGVAQASPPDVSSCKGGGFTNYIDPVTGKPFSTQGRCVSVVARGGTLVPVTPPVRQYGPWLFQYDQGNCNAYLTFIGQAGTTYPVTFYSSTGSVLYAYETTAASDGSFTVGGAKTPAGVPVTVAVGSQTFVSPVLQCVQVSAAFSAEQSIWTDTAHLVTGQPNTHHRVVWHVANPAGSTPVDQSVDVSVGADGTGDTAVTVPVGASLSGDLDGVWFSSPGYHGLP